VCPASSPPRPAPQAVGILERCQAGDEVAWAEAIERFSSYVTAIAVRDYGLDHASAEDVLQDVLARTYEHIDRLHNDAAIRPWIGQLTRRLCVDRLRASSRVELCEVPPTWGAEDPALAGIEESMTVAAGLALLSDDQRTVLERFYLYDESYETIGAALNIPSGTIASRISRGLNTLRGELEGRIVAVLVVLFDLAPDGLADTAALAAPL
jgi:RNA polymerase sigma factor (sigma-70 family)